MSRTDDEVKAVARVERWVREVVIGLELCPFAAEPFERGLVHYALSPAEDPVALQRDLERELSDLDRIEFTERETTLLIHPHTLTGFPAFNAFLDVADATLEQLGLLGTLQIASFHPDYCFAGANVDDAANYTNRAPYPILHLLREQSVARAVEGLEDPSAVPRRNVGRLRELGREAMEARLRALRG